MAMAGRSAAAGARVCLLLALAAAATHAYYVPGTYPQEFWPGDVIQGERGPG